MALNVGINGFGRIGRIIFRTCFKNPGLKVTAINDPAVDIEYICYLIKFDSTHGKFKGALERSDNEISIDGHKIAIFKEKLPTNIPWQVADVQYVVEASGMFTNLEKSSGHLTSEGVKRVLVTAPSLDVPMVVLGVNDNKLSAGHKVISCASSTLYCLAPIIKILEDHFGVSEGFITSIHAMTPSLKPLDGLCLKGKHWRDHRSIHQNIIPATTGACRALGRIIPQVKDKMTGLAFRVPIVNVSVLDITIRLKTNTSMEGIIKHVKNAGNSNMKNIIKVSNEQAVSSDFVGDTFSCILDLDSSLQLTSDFFKLICWYENEHSYACRIVDSIFFLERQYQLEWTSKMSYIRPTSKQSFIQKKESNNKFTYHQACSYECHSNMKSLCSSSQDSGFKSSRRSSVTKKLLCPRNFGTRKFPYTSRDSKRSNELFKIWHDEDEIVKEPARQNRSSFFHSCVAITPQFNTTASVKTRERLENVKREFSKMVIMTEHLLKQSQHSKIEIGSLEVSQNNAGATNMEDTSFIVDKKNYIDEGGNNIAINCNDNKNEEIKDNNTHVKVNEISNSTDKSASAINEILINKQNDSDTRNNVANDQTTIDQLINIDCNFRPILSHNEDDKEKRTSDIGPKLNPDASNDYEIIENITNNNDNTNDLPTFISNYPLKDQNRCQNQNGEIHPLIYNEDRDNYSENNKCPQIEFWNDQALPAHKKQSESFSTASVNTNVTKVPDNIGNNGFDAENTHIPNKQGCNLQLRLESVLKKLAIDSNVVSEKPSTCLSSINTITTASNRDIKQKQDIYDKLDSVSATDSENSFHMKERKSQVIKITDLTNSLEDLDRLDKICRIIEISDELSDQLLSALNSNDCKELKNRKWSFKDFCEKIKLDEFCNKIFNKSNS